MGGLYHVTYHVTRSRFQRRDHQLVGPISLYLLAVADSGERKTTCDAIFCPALRDWETGRRRDMSPEIAKLEAATAVFEAKKAGILKAIKHKRLAPAVLDLSPQARAGWIRFHNAVERELGARGALRGVRDVAAKAAENAARLAALFHVLEHGASGSIAFEEIRAAACIVGRHLNEARRLLADLDTPPSLAAAIRLDAWLRDEAIANGTDRVPAKRIYQYGPNCVRDSRDLRAALAILAEHRRARMEEDGHRRAVAINPALLDGRE